MGDMTDDALRIDEEEATEPIALELLLPAGASIDPQGNLVLQGGLIRLEGRRGGAALITTGSLDPVLSFEELGAIAEWADELIVASLPPAEIDESEGDEPR